MKRKTLFWMLACVALFLVRCGKAPVEPAFGKCEGHPTYLVLSELEPDYLELVKNSLDFFRLQGGPLLRLPGKVESPNARYVALYHDDALCKAKKLVAYQREEGGNHALRVCSWFIGKYEWRDILAIPFMQYTGKTFASKGRDVWYTKWNKSRICVFAGSRL